MNENLTFFYPDNHCTTRHISTKQSRVTLNCITRNPGTYIYCNYPEDIGKDGKGLGLAEKGYCINKQLVEPGSAQIFWSHNNYFGAPLYYNVLIKNVSNRTAYVNIPNCGTATGWPMKTNPGQTIIDYYNSSNKMKTVYSGTCEWLLNEDVKADPGNPSTALIKIKTDQPVEVIVYASSRKLIGSNFKGNEQPFPYDTNNTYSSSSTYSGRGDSYFLTVNHPDVYVQATPDVIRKHADALPLRFQTNESNKLYRPINSNEITDIELAGAKDLVASRVADAPLNNLGNYCTQYQHNFTFHNNTNKQVDIFGFIGNVFPDEANGNTQFVRCGSDMDSVVLAKENHYPGGILRTWKWCKITIPAGEDAQISYQTVLATFGSSRTYHLFSLDEHLDNEVQTF